MNSETHFVSCIFVNEFLNLHFTLSNYIRMVSYVDIFFNLYFFYALKSVEGYFEHVMVMN